MENKIILDEFITFKILDMVISLASSETAYGWKTFAEVGEEYIQYGDENLNIETAIDIYQYLNNRKLSAEDIQIIMDENYKDIQFF